MYQLLRVLSVSGLFIAAALAYTGGLQGTGDTKSPLYISIISQVVLPLGICFVITKTGTLQPIHIWLAILTGHVPGACSVSCGSARQMALDRGGYRAHRRLKMNNQIKNVEFSGEF